MNNKIISTVSKVLEQYNYWYYVVLSMLTVHELIVGTLKSCPICCLLFYHLCLERGR